VSVRKQMRAAAKLLPCHETFLALFLIKRPAPPPRSSHATRFVTSKRARLRCEPVHGCVTSDEGFAGVEPATLPVPTAPPPPPLATWIGGAKAQAGPKVCVTDQVPG